MTAGASWGPASEPDAPRHGVCDSRGPYHEYARRVRTRHYWVPDTALCACTELASLCPELRDAHELFGDHVPWQPQDTMPLRPPASRPGPRSAPHPVEFRQPPRPYPRQQ